MHNFIYPIIGKQTELPFYLSGIGISRPEYHVTRENGLVSHQLLLTEKGAGTLLIDGKRLTLGAGSLFYVSPYVPHEYFPVGEEWTTYWLVFRGELLPEIMQKLGFGSYDLCEGAEIAPLMRLFGMLFAAAGDPINGAEVCSELIYEYILTARRQLLSGTNGKSSAGSAIGSALVYINGNFRRDITLEQLAGLSGVSLQHFCRLFKAQTGLRPMEYIARKRIAEAKALLMNTDDSIAQIGAATGYSNPTYFGMVFRRHEGISPSEYRRLRGSFSM